MATSWKIVTPSSLAGLMRDVINADSSGVRSTIVNLIRATVPDVGGGLAELPAGTLIAVSPTGGRWVLPARPAGARFLLIPGGGVGLPTAADGVTDVDLIVVGGTSAGGTYEVAGTVLLSDSFTGAGTSTLDLTSTAVDRAAGGAAATWQTYTDASGAGDKHLHRQIGSGSVDLYGSCAAWLPCAVADVTCTVELGSATNGGRVIVRGNATPPLAAGAQWIGFGFAGSQGALTVAGQQRDGTTITDITTRVAVNAGSTVSMTLVGQSATLKINGTKVATGSATVQPQPGYVGLATTTYLTLNLGSILVEAA